MLLLWDSWYYETLAKFVIHTYVGDRLAIGQLVGRPAP